MAITNQDIEYANFRSGVESIKARLRIGGGIVHGLDRGCGKSTAILELCCEWGAADCVVLVPTLAAIHELHHLWLWLIPEELRKPTARVVTWRCNRDNTRLYGLDRETKILIDDCRLMERGGPDRKDLDRFEFYTGIY